MSDEKYGKRFCETPAYKKQYEESKSRGVDVSGWATPTYSDENDPAIRNSQFIPLDVSLAAANAENESLRAKLKDAEVGLRNGEKIAGERIAQLKKTADARLTTTFIFAGVGGAIICAGMCWASFLKEDRNAIQKQFKDEQEALGVVERQRDRAEAKLREQAKKLKEEKAELEKQKADLETLKRLR